MKLRANEYQKKIRNKFFIADYTFERGAERERETCGKGVLQLFTTSGAGKREECTSMKEGDSLKRKELQPVEKCETFGVECVDIY
jgi:hypothetical protein